MSVLRKQVFGKHFLDYLSISLKCV